jgi:glycosyltransferase involved in cell wall biosynthesis
MEGCGDGTDRLAYEYLSRGDKVLVLTDQESECERPYAATSVGRSFNVHATRRALSCALEFNPDAALIQYTPFLYSPKSLFPLLLARGLCRSGVPTGIFAHECFYPCRSLAVRSTLKHRYLTLKDAITLRAADVIFVPNEEKRVRVAAHLRHARVVVLAVAANIEPVTVMPRRVAEPPFRLLAFGVVMPRRRIDLLIKAVAALAHIGLDAHLTVAGRVWDESYATYCRRLSNELGLAHRVTIAGALSNERLSAAFADHDIFLHAAEEGAVASAGSLLAALAHGIPVIAVRTGHDEARFARGVVFTQANPEQIARSCAKLLQQPAKLEQFASASRLLYDAAFGWSRIVNAIDVALPQRQHQAAV